MSDDKQALAERLFTTFLAPLVLGGAMTPGKPIGGRAAFSLGADRPLGDIDLVSRVTLARVRVARAIVPVDRFEPAPRADEWVLGAVLHDLVQATHPGFDAALRRSGPRRLLAVATATLERVSLPKDAAVALSRHTWVGRMFEIGRTDTVLKWWTGASTFLGEDPPARLLAWPELRRVRETRTERRLVELPGAGGVVDEPSFTEALQRLVERTPLTSFANLDRVSPAFAWTPATLELASTTAGRTMVTRLLDRKPSKLEAKVLGRATRGLLQARSARALLVAVDVLRDRALKMAESRLAGAREVSPLALPADGGDEAFAVAVGALAATTWLREPSCGLRDVERSALIEVLGPASRSALARDAFALLAG